MLRGILSKSQLAHFPYIKRYHVKDVGRGDKKSKKRKLNSLISTKIYSDTLHLPKTEFNTSVTNGVSSLREKSIQKIASFSNLYQWQEKQDRDEVFVLHDGPPYANGDVHVGHAINKILKDITNRYKLIRGYKIHYVPGWDCHGLPIELKAFSLQKLSSGKLSVQDIRNRARDYADGAIKKQMEAFKRWGIMADWSNCYFTYDKHYEARQIELFYQLYEKGYVYQEYMPVYWSPSTRTALAEAEIEYNDSHVSQAVYVKFRITQLPEKIREQLGGNHKIYSVVWTTTPWSLPGNKAICYGKKIRYCFVKNKSNSEIYLIGCDLVDKLAALINTKLEPVLTVQGIDLNETQYQHPFDNDEKPFLHANHVSTEKGTGLVHTAPAHGYEDFQIALRHHLSLDCLVDEDGKYTNEAGFLSKKSVLSEGNMEVLSYLSSHILHQCDYVHSYPYDWRSKKPVITRASKQWFINTEKISNKALECLKDIKFSPPSAESKMINQLKARTYWCISRQRAWGVPIPVFQNSETGETLLSRETIDHLVKLFEKEGADCWWNKPLRELLPDHLLKKLGIDASIQFKKGQDILDIWLDSGSSWACVLKTAGHECADVYLEGSDQFSGWFQSSLLTSVAATGKPPFKNVISHGFTVDENGKKMSKSLGNVIDPQVICDGGKNHSKQPAYGADVLRWWAAKENSHSNVEISIKILEECNEKIFKMRKVVKFLIGNLHDFNPKQRIKYNRLLPQDKYMLYRLFCISNRVTKQYDEFLYNIVMLEIERFVNAEVSGFYFSIVKDRLYCNLAASHSRRSCQTVLYHILVSLSKLMSPILPHFSEEVFGYIPRDSDDDDGNRHASIFHTPWEFIKPVWNNKEAEVILSPAFSIRDEFLKTIGSSNSALYDVIIGASDKLMSNLQKLQNTESSSHSALTEIIQCACTSLSSNPAINILDDAQKVQGTIAEENEFLAGEKFTIAVISAMKQRCPRCRKYTTDKPQNPCSRCLEVLSEGWE